MTLTLAVVALALFAGALVQGVAGLGLGLVGAPVVTLADPSLMPGFMLVLAMLLPVATLVGERDDVDWRGLGWSLPSRVPGTAVGAWLVVVLSDRWLTLAVGVIVLAAVALTWRAVVVPVNAGTLLTAGFVSGVAGTATSIGGPPMALLYQHRPARQVRTTLAVYFLLGALLSLAGLLVAGELRGEQVWPALAMLPVVGLGALVATRLRGLLDGEWFRVVVLVVCAASATALVLRALV